MKFVTQCVLTVEDTNLMCNVVTYTGHCSADKLHQTICNYTKHVLRVNKSFNRYTRLCAELFYTLRMCM